MSGRYFDRKEVSVGIVVIVSEIEINEGGNWQVSCHVTTGVGVVNRLRVVRQFVCV